MNGRNFKHGHKSTSGASPTYYSWTCMRTRCLNKNRPDYPYYGGRGIKVCDRWSRFVNFLADMGERPEGCSLDRIDPDGDYRPGNCRWTDKTTQNQNRRYCK